MRYDKTDKEIIKILKNKIKESKEKGNIFDRLIWKMRYSSFLEDIKEDYIKKIK